MKNGSMTIVIAAIVVVLVGGGIIFATMRGGTDTTGTASDSQMMMNSDLPSMEEAEETNTVEIKSFAFAPQAIKVKAGTEVTWTNQDTVKHNAVKDDGQADGPDGPLLAKGESYSYTYEKPGMYTYHCAPHLSMTGVVYVTE